MKNLALNVVVGGAISSSFKSSMSSSNKLISKIGSSIKKMNKEKIDIKRFRQLQKNTVGNRKEFLKLGRSLKKSGHDLNNFKKYTVGLNKELFKLKTNLIIKGKIQFQKDKLLEQRDSLLATFGTGMAIGGFINLRSEILQAQGELKSLKIGDIGIKAITKEAKDFSNQFSGTTAPQFIKASYDIKSGISSLGDVAVGKFTRFSAITAGATKSSTTQMTSFFATGYGIYSKQYDAFATKTVKDWKKLSQEEKDIKFGETFASGIGAAVQMFKTDGTKMQDAIETLGAQATTSNVSFSEQLAILGSMQKSFASGSEAATSYKGFLNGAVEAQEKLNLSFLDANNQLKSAPLILEELRNKYGETLDDMEKQEIKKAFGTEEGMKFITSFYGEVDELKNSINGMDKAVKGGTKTIDEMMKATQRGKGFSLLGQQLSNLGATIGKVFYPAAEMLGSIIGSVAIGLDSLINTFPMLSTGIGYLVVGTFSYIAITKTAKIVTIGFKIANLALRGSFIGNIKTLKRLRLSYNRLNIVSGISTVKTKALTLWTSALSTKQKVGAIASKLWASGILLANRAMGIAKIGVRTLIGATGIGLLLVAAGLVYEYWSPIKEFFSDLWSGIQDKAMPFFNWIGEKINGIGSVIKSISGFFGFGKTDEVGQKLTNKSFSPGATIKRATAATIATTQLVAAQPNINYASIPKHNSIGQKEVKQVNHITVTINNPSSTVDVERGIKRALLSNSNSLNDEEL